MGHGFGHLYHGLRIILISLSPFEQRAFAGTIVKGIPRTIRRSFELAYIAPPAILAMLVFNLGETLHKKKMRKRPSDYEDET